MPNKKLVFGSLVIVAITSTIAVVWNDPSSSYSLVPSAKPPVVRATSGSSTIGVSPSDITSRSESLSVQDKKLILENFQRWANNDRPKLIDSILNCNNQNTKALLLTLAARSDLFSIRDIYEMLTESSLTPALESKIYLEAMLGAKLKAEDAEYVLKKLPSGNVRSSAVSGLFQNDSIFSSGSFKALFKSLDYPEDKEIATAAMRETLSRPTNVQLADSIASSADMPLEIRSVAAAAFGSLKGEALGTGEIRVALQHLEPQYRAVAEKAAIESKIRVDPQSVAAFALEDADVLSTYGGKVLNELAQKDPRAACVWAGSAVEVNSDLLRDGVLIWLHQNSESASIWVRGLSAGNTRNVAVQSMIKYLENNSDFESAEAWRKVITIQ